MKKLSLSIFVLGALNASLWIWAPILMRLQARNVFERYGALESLELAVQVFQESMRFTYIAAGFIGAVMLLSAVLLYSRRMAGWHLWVTCLAVNAVGAMVDILRGGMSGGAVVRLLVLAAFAYSTVRVYRSAAWSNWFSVKASP